MAEKNNKIVIIEDNQLVRESLKLLISGIGGYLISGSFESCENAFKNFEKDVPGLVLMDLELPGMNGIEGIKYIKKHWPEVEVIMLTVHDDSELVFKALIAGASGYITKDSSHNKILDAIDEIHKGGAPMSMPIARMIVDSFQRNLNTPISPRETEVLELLASGKSYSVIADELFIHKETVKTHIKNIYIKLHVNSKAAAIEFAKKNRLI
jgi:DNA-binding NarL/FixJ family response regulator